MESDNTFEILRRLTEMIEGLKKDTFSLEEAAEYLKTTKESVEYYSKRQKQLTHINLGGTLVFRRADLEEFLEKKIKKAFIF